MTRCSGLKFIVHQTFFPNKTDMFLLIRSCKARPCIHDYNYLVFPFHFQLRTIIIAVAKCAVKISFLYQKNKEDNSSLLCIKLSFLIRLICFCLLSYCSFVCKGGLFLIIV